MAASEPRPPSSNRAELKLEAADLHAIGARRAITGGTPASDPIRRTALEYSNVTDCQRLPRTATDLVTCPNDPQDDLAAESSHRGGQGFKSPQLRMTWQDAMLAWKIGVRVARRRRCLLGPEARPLAWRRGLT